MVREESVLYSSYIVYENNKQLLIHDKYGINFVDIGDWVKKGENGVFVYSDNSFRYRCVEIKEPDCS